MRMASRGGEHSVLWAERSFHQSPDRLFPLAPPSKDGKGISMHLHGGSIISLDHSHATREEIHRHYLSLLEEVSGVGDDLIGRAPLAILYSALQGWRWVMDFQVGPLFEPEEMDAVADLKLELARKIVEWLAKLLWRMSDLQAKCCAIEPVMLLAIVSAHANPACRIKSPDSALRGGNSCRTQTLQSMQNPWYRPSFSLG